MPSGDAFTSSMDQVHAISDRMNAMDCGMHPKICRFFSSAIGMNPLAGRIRIIHGCIAAARAP
jgi:hypothetical protein